MDFLEIDHQGQELELRRRPLVGFDFSTLTGLPLLDKSIPLPPIQLLLPLAV